MKVKLEIEVVVDHDAEGFAQSCPELVAKRVKEALDDGFAPSFLTSKYMMATSVKVTGASDFDEELEVMSSFISKYFNTEHKRKL